MPEKVKNTLSLKCHHKQMKVPFVIYADFEGLVRKIPGCEHGPGSFMGKTEWHEACGFSYIVVRSDGGQKPQGMFLRGNERMGFSRAKKIN